ncbi:enoyl-[acyl-carrier-protein] reductase FabL [candidate division KSB1 bacterium]|nr:enoyl-[acyl-carrier-protein] reductase FabL [candidate division KSB1 bacterium]RQW00698.1 MAG: enoyl-[acyl-carrier-protein] reductase FabL [candidate division KSB1 bacterium]
MENLSLSLKGKVSLVTGGSRGIGRAIAIKLAQAGSDVAINYLRHREAADETIKLIEQQGVKALAIRANVGEHENIHHMIDHLNNEFGRLDILISNAASGVLKPALELTERHWHWTMDINAGTLLPLTQHALPLMKNGGTIVAVSSLGSIRAIPNYAAVGASKAALESLIRHLAIELAPMGIKVNAVSAGTVETDALKYFPNREDIIEESKKRTPTGRLTTPEDVANVALYLCSPFSNQIQGQTIVIDGGYSIVA